MTDIQIQFFLDNFFQHDHASNDFPGWKGIAKKLIVNGQCTVAGNGELWWGGIGNFIQKEEAPDAVDCTRLTFDMKEFTSQNNQYFQQTLDRVLLQKHEEIMKLQKEVQEILAVQEQEA